MTNDDENAVADLIRSVYRVEAILDIDAPNSSAYTSQISRIRVKQMLMSSCMVQTLRELADQIDQYMTEVKG